MIDCVMVQADDLEIAADFYSRVFGLRRLWSDESSIGMGMPETDAEVVLHTTDLPRERGVHYLVDDVPATVLTYHRQGCVVREPPFDIAVGRCAVLEEPFGNVLCILDMSNGPRQVSPRNG
jgi:lactoylglutathione lyase